jgi:predicted LPLAT superfamily acyltransferase
VTSPPAWHRRQERGSLLGMRLVVWLYRCVGRRLCGVLILPVIGYFFLTGGPARRASRRYLERLHEWSGGRLPRRRRPSWWDGFLHHREFGLNILDRVGFWLGDTRGIDLVVHGREHLERLRDTGRGAVIVSAHLGSFDALRLYSVQAAVVVNVVMYLEHARMINAIFKQLRPEIDGRLLTPDPGSFAWLFGLRDRIASGEMLGVLGDRVGPHEGRHVSRLPFLGLPARFPHGPFRLAASLDCPLLLMVGLRRGPRQYEIFVESLAPGSPRSTEPVEALLSTYVRRLEFYCTQAPYQWFNFYDFWAEAGGAPADSPPEVGAAAAGGWKGSR